MAPDTFANLVNTVERYAKRGSCEYRWQLNAIGGNIPANRLNAYPFATPDAVGVHLACRRGNLTVSADVSSNPKTVWRDFLPSILWEKSIQNYKHEFQLFLTKPLAAVTESVREGTAPIFAYTLFHPFFTFNSESHLLDGLYSTLSATTRLSANDQFGLSAVYDPSRSGVKDYTIAFARAGCNVLRGGDWVAKYNATRGAALHMRIQVKGAVSAVVLAEKLRFVVGAEATSPCGAQMMMNVNLMNTQATFSMVRHMEDMWKITVCCTAPLCGGTTAAPKFGILFSTPDSY